MNEFTSSSNFSFDGGGSRGDGGGGDGGRGGGGGNVSSVLSMETRHVEDDDQIFFHFIVLGVLGTGVNVIGERTQLSVHV